MNIQKNLNLDPSKNYLLYLSLSFPNSAPIVNLLSNYNPIFISAGVQKDSFGNFIHFDTNPRDLSYEGLANILYFSEDFNNLINNLKKNQSLIQVKMFRNHPSFLKLFEDEQISPLGFTPEEAENLNSKFYQYNLLDGIVPIADFEILETNVAVNKYSDFASSLGVFTSLNYGGGGSGSLVHSTEEKFRNYIDFIQDDSLILAKALDVYTSPSIDVLVANEKEFFSYGIVDQLFDESGFSCIGGSYPSKLPKKVKSEVIDLVNEVARTVAKEGFRGYFSVDVLVDKGMNVYFCEINGRYSGTTGPRLWAMEQSRPANHPSIVDLEMMALNNGTFNGYSLWDEPTDISWFKKELVENQSGIINPLVINNSVAKVFSEKGLALLGQLPANSLIGSGNNTYLGNLIGVESDLQTLNQSLKNTNILVDKYCSISKHR